MGVWNAVGETEMVVSWKGAGTYIFQGRIEKGTPPMLPRLYWYLSSEAHESIHACSLPMLRVQTARVAAIISPVWFLAQGSYNWSLGLTSVTVSTVLNSTSR